MNDKLKNKYIELNEKYGSIKIKCKGADTLPIDAIMDFQGGLKKLKAAKKIKLATLIFSKGFIAPFFIWDNKGDYNILDGHQRSTVLCEIREAGVEIPGLFPVVYIEAENEHDAKEKLLAISSQFGEFDEDELKTWLEGLDEEITKNITLVNKEIELLSNINNETIDDDDLIENANNITKSGDIWELGKNKLLCGDSQDENNFKLLLGDKTIDMVFTDPPYGVNYSAKNEMLNKFDGGKRIQKTIANDNLKKNDLEIKLISCFSNIKNNLAVVNSIFIFCASGGEMLMMMMNAMNKSMMPFKHMIIWKKNNHVLGRCDYNYKHEPILLTWVGKHKFYGLGEQKTSVWEYDKPNKCDLHPTMKPVALVENALLNNSEKGNIIFDAFLGSGTTIIACEKTERICYGMEIEPNYCDVIVKRYIDWMKKNNKEINIKLNGEKFEIGLFE